MLIDQLDGTNLVSIEAMFRSLQTIEFGHGDRVKDAESRAVGGRLSLEEQAVFSGVGRSHSALMVCPDLLDHVRTEVERDAKLAKAMRTAREEREEKRKEDARRRKGGKGKDKEADKE